MSNPTLFAFAVVLMTGCVAGPGNKPGTMSWKVYKEVTSLATPAANWTQGQLQFELAKVEFVRNYTVLKTESYRLYFHVNIKNTGSTEGDVFGTMPKGSLTLQDGTHIDRLVWSASSVKLGPGVDGTVMYFSDNSLNEGARPKKLAMDGAEVARW